MVYVDDAKNKYGRMLMCHMVADTLDELHEMADKIGIKRKWFQSAASCPHYDICRSKRELAIQFGAKAIHTRTLVQMIQGWRVAGDVKTNKVDK